MEILQAAASAEKGIAVADLTYKLRRLSDYPVIPSTERLIDPYLPLGGQIVLAALPKTFKTYVALKEYALNRNRHLFPTPEGWNDALWREHFITNRIRRLIKGGFWSPPIGWCTDLLSDGAYELPKEDFIESLNPRRPDSRSRMRSGCDDRRS